ncbi:hypothetical protein [Microbulbifer sp. VAAF005]|uniref:beta strand repeat-containing protein n=1 Tax=Microbulbifer sp. VAAF005 TaxID=3034230 RepID=UPI0024ADEEAF|nr:hypothetical protein [Microbulbifer sp. VAAF005]WHI45750.1 hypothetical protein P0078_18790 [Microbulbifer sp. VAAF005]
MDEIWGEGGVQVISITGEGSVLHANAGIFLGITNISDFGEDSSASMIVEDGGAVSTLSAYIGAENEAVIQVTGENSSFDASDYLAIGSKYNGTLAVEDGGTVTTDIFKLGAFSDSENGDGIANISGANSRIYANKLNIGHAGGSGNLTIEEGGAAFILGSAYLGKDGGVGVATVSGTDSLLDIHGDLVLGDDASGYGSVVLEDGGAVSIGQNALVGGTSVGQKTIMVTGENSQLHIQENLQLLSGGNPVSLSIESGGGLSVGADITNPQDGLSVIEVIGTDSKLEAGGSLFLANGNRNNVIISIREGAELSGGDDSTLGQASSFSIDLVDLGSTFNLDGSLYLGSADSSPSVHARDGGKVSIQDSLYFSGNNLLNSHIVMSGMGSSLEVGENLYIANEANSFASLVLESDGNASANAAFIGMGGEGAVDIGGSAKLGLSNQLYLGFHNGSTGTLNIQSGGEADVLEDAVIGREGNGNALITGEGVSLDIGEDLVLGLFSGSEGSLTINNEGTVRVGGDATFGVKGEGLGTVSGAGSTLDVGTNLYIGGDDTSVAVLSVSDGGTVATDGETFIGLKGQGTVHVNGDDSLMYVGDALYIGHEPAGKGYLEITSAGTLEAAYDTNIGVNGRGYALVSGEGSRLDVGHTLNIGNAAGDYSLDIANGGAVSTGWETVIGASGAGSARVTGESSRLDVALALTLGYTSGGSGSLLIENGGTVSTGRFPFIGFEGEGAVTITGEGSTLHTNGTVYLGHEAAGSGELLINDGGSLTSEDGAAIGLYGLGSAILSGSGVSLSVANNLSLGHFAGSSGVLYIEDGSDVGVGATAVIGQIGSGSVTVTGMGSSLVIEDLLSLGHLADDTGAGVGTLTIEDSGSVSTQKTAYIGYAGMGSATVTGGAQLDMNGSLHLGQLTGSSGVLKVQDGGAVSAQVNALIGYDGMGEASVTGAGSTLDTDGLMILGRHDSSSGSLTIGDGGAVSVGGEVIIGDAGIGEITVSGTDSRFETQGTVRIGEGVTSTATMLIGPDSTFKANRLLAGSGTISVTVDGATLQAGANNSLFISGFSGTEFTVGSNGMLLDTNGFNIGIHGDIEWSRGGVDHHRCRDTNPGYRPIYPWGHNGT